MKSKIKKIGKNVLAKLGIIAPKYQCSVCNSEVNYYLPLPKSFQKNSEEQGYPYFGQNEHLNINSYYCPNCRCSDRDRLYAAYFLKRLKIPRGSGKTLLHIAPSWPLDKNFLTKHFDVTTTDLMMKDVDIHLDIEDMHAFADKSFDYIICSHVLEHVNNPDIALREMLRVLKPGGRAIIMAPINPNISKTLEDPSHTTEKERLQHYGQEDHLRLFAKDDFMQRITASGFTLDMIDKSMLGRRTYLRLGLRMSSVLYTGIRKKQDPN